MTTSKYDRFIQIWEAADKTHLRMGQSLMGELYKFDKWEYSRIVFKLPHLDCFFNDKHELTLNYLKETWAGQ